MGFDKELTKQLLGEVGPLRFNPKVVKICEQCRTPHIVRYKGGGKPTAPYFCRSCVVNRPEVKRKLSSSAKKQWANPEFAELVRASSRSIWTDQERRSRMNQSRTPELIAALIARNQSRIYDGPGIAKRMKALWEQEGYRSRMTEILGRISRRAWASDEYREKIRQATLANWRNPEYRARIEKNLLQARRSMPRVSSLQTILYSILTDLGVNFYREHKDAPPDPACLIGPYVFDCVVPRATGKTLLIECQGDYWHRDRRRDEAKANYIANNFGDQYELKYIWEHEFHNYGKVVELVKYWLGITEFASVEYDLASLEVKEADATATKLLLSKYHYLTTIGRHGRSIGAYLGDELVAVCVFTPLVRQNITIPGRQRNEVRELSRFCVHPKYRKKNLGSWLITRAIRMLDPSIKSVISYSDRTFNHHGSIYKACNFTLDKIVPPDYWYVSDDGWAIHKKKLYNHAVKMGMTEAEFAADKGYNKVWGKEKLRFILHRC